MGGDIPLTSNSPRDPLPVRPVPTRPPVRQSTLVRSELTHTFETFVRTIGQWWPVQRYSDGQKRVRNVTFEPRLGGRVYETWEDGTVVDWGKLIKWDPPRRFRMTWALTPAVTEVELTFADLGPALTRVTVEHRGWEALTEEQLAADACSYTAGWLRILSCLTAAAEGAGAS
jgi:uncharacterized protein YndB with AHSA1/START domain